MPPNDDFLGEIFIRLPAESLIRSRAVCKSWRAIIDKMPFARAHQHQPIDKNIIIIETDSPSTFYSLDLEALSFSNGHQTIAATPLDFSDNRPWSALGACKGLVLTDKPLGIWNPSTNERLDLPPISGFEHDAEASYGLGYDFVTDDYKAVSILSTTKPFRTSVYSLKSDSWRTITNCPQGPIGCGVFVCGALNWISSYNNKIVALDHGTEKYTLLCMPRRRWDRFHNDTFLDVLGGCLILCASGYNGELDGWVMKDYGDEGSWIELFSINHRSRDDCSLSLVGFIVRKEEEENKMRLQVFMKEYYQGSFFPV